VEHSLTVSVNGCPIPSIVAACALDEATVTGSQLKVGQHAEMLQDSELQAVVTSFQREFSDLSRV
jgi:hypothetical protein